MGNLNKRKLIIIAVIAVIILLIGAVTLLVWRGLPLNNGNRNGSVKVTEDMSKQMGEEAAKETQKLIDEVKEIAADIDSGKAEDKNISQVVTFTKTETNGTSTKTTTEQAVVVAPQSNPISIDTGEVLTRDGSKEVNNNLQAGDPNAPVQSDPVDPAKLPESTVKISISPTGITPKEFSVKAGQAVALAITAESSIEIFKFDDPSLSAVAMGLKPGESRVITFNAPAKAGQYSFYSDYAGHRSSGAEGKMIVN